MLVPPDLVRWTTMTAAILAFAPVVAFGLCSEALIGRIRALPTTIQIWLPAVLAIPYLLAIPPLGWFRWEWFGLYALLPVVVTAVLSLVAKIDPEQNGHWLEF